MRILIMYDCLFPHTVGGAERWYRNVAERLAAEGHDVTYVTLRQWEPGEDVSFGGVDVVAVGPRMELYVDGRRRIAPPLVFGAGVLRHLVRHGRSYDVVHTASFPYFSLLAAGLLRRPCGYRLVADWHEVWSREYWVDYLGGAGGRVGDLVQRICARLRHRAFCFSRLHRDRLRAYGFRGEVTALTGEYAGDLTPPQPSTADTPPVVIFAGRHIPEKRAPLVVPAIAAARERIPDLRAVIYGDGPERDDVLAAIERHGLQDAVTAPGFVDASELEAAYRGALCMLLPSSREGYGMVVVESCARGTPVLVVAGPDNAAVELVDEGDNGYVAATDDPDAIADAIVRVQEAGPELRRSTCDWFVANAQRLSIDGSLEQVMASYGT